MALIVPIFIAFSKNGKIIFFKKYGKMTIFYGKKEKTLRLVPNVLKNTLFRTIKYKYNIDEGYM
jgi:hypothetical protein